MVVTGLGVFCLKVSPSRVKIRAEIALSSEMRLCREAGGQFQTYPEAQFCR